MKYLGWLSSSTFNFSTDGLEKNVKSGMKVIPSICRMCTATCSILAEVRNNEVVRVYGNPYAKYHNKGHICPRGNSGPLQLNNPDRLRSPLRRRGGRRGEWSFEEISYDVALDELARIIKEKKEQGESHKIILISGQAATLYSEPLGKAIAPTIGTDNIVNLPLSTCIGSKLLAWGFTGVPGQHAILIADFERTKFHLSYGRNLGGSVAVGLTTKAGHALGNYKLVVMDPRLSEWASKADQWIPTKPGTDLAVLLAIMNVILEEGLYDEKYLKKYTNAPMLIDKESLEPIKTKEIKLKNPIKEFDAIDFLVYDEISKEFKFSREAKDPSLTYEGEYEGEEATTVFNALKEHIKDYTPEWAEKISGVPAEVIIKLAMELAITKPASLEPGWSANKYFNLFQLYRTAAVLTVLTGNLLRPGGVVLSMGGIGKVLQRTNPPIAGPPVTPKPSMLYEYEKKTKIKLSDGSITEGPLLPWGKGYHGLLKAAKEEKGLVIIVIGSNPARTFMGGAFQKIASSSNVEKIIDIGLMKDDTVAYSDLFIPECGYLERYNLLSGIPFSLAKGFMAAFPAVKTNCLSFLEIWTKVFEKAGLFEEFSKRLSSALCPGCDFRKVLPKLREALIKSDFESIIKMQSEKNKVDFNEIKNKGVYYSSDESWGLEMNEKILKNGWLKTASGKIEIMPIKLLKIIRKLKGEIKAEWHPLPTWVPPLWMSRIGDDEFVLLTGKERNMSYSWTQPNPLLSWIIDEEKKIWVNARRAKQLGLRDGKEVEVCSGSNCIRGPVKVTEGIVPEAVYVPPNYGFEVKLTFGKYKSLRFNLLQDPDLIDPITGTHLMADVIVKVKEV